MTRGPDLLAFARLDVDDDARTGVRRKKPLSAATTKRVAGIRARVGASAGDVWEEGGPAARLAAFRSKLVRALHDQTIGNDQALRGNGDLRRGRRGRERDRVTVLFENGERKLVVKDE